MRLLIISCLLFAMSMAQTVDSTEGDFCELQVHCDDQTFCSFERNGVDGFCVSCVSVLPGTCDDLEYHVFGQQDCSRTCEYSVSTDNVQIVEAQLQDGSTFSILDGICNLAGSQCADMETQCMYSYCRESDNSCFQQGKEYGTACTKTEQDVNRDERTINGVCVNGECVFADTTVDCPNAELNAERTFGNCGNADFQKTVRVEGGSQCVSVGSDCQEFGPANSNVYCWSSQTANDEGHNDWEIRYASKPDGNCIIGDNPACVVSTPGTYSYMGMTIEWSGTIDNGGTIDTYMRIPLTTMILIPVFHCEEPPCRGSIQCDMFGPEPCGRIVQTCDQTYSPTANPTIMPTSNPSCNPSSSPSMDPTLNPSLSPTSDPSLLPTFCPSKTPSKSPSDEPSIAPTSDPSMSPSKNPTMVPSMNPSLNPTKTPSSNPSMGPTLNPSLSPTSNPSAQPTLCPSKTPTQSPSYEPSIAPTSDPSMTPSKNPTMVPSMNPSMNPTKTPSASPSMEPTSDPSMVPSSNPTMTPSKTPSRNPTMNPSKNPTYMPTANPTAPPTGSPTIDPTREPSTCPSECPTSSNPSLTPSFTQGGAGNCICGGYRIKKGRFTR